MSAALDHEWTIIPDEVLWRYVSSMRSWTFLLIRRRGCHKSRQEPKDKQSYACKFYPSIICMWNKIRFVIYFNKTFYIVDSFLQFVILQWPIVKQMHTFFCVSVYIIQNTGGKSPCITITKYHYSLSLKMWDNSLTSKESIMKRPNNWIRLK